jgi:uncharacterized repeat protein (TIGR02543 family)
MSILLLIILLVACGNKKEPPVLEDDLVVFDTQGGSVIDPVKYEESFLLQAPAFPEKEGYVFNGWYKDEEFTQVWDFENDYVTGAMKLYAKWKKVETDYNNTFKVLSIGNSFSEDAHKYLWSIAHSYGIDNENIIVANMYIGGSELRQHVENLNGDRPNYTYQKYVGPQMISIGSAKLSDVIADEDWDLITFQQASHFSGLASEYKNYLNTLISWAKDNTTNDDVLIGWHMTWAYDQSSNHSGFANYDKNQATMLEMIKDTLYKKVYNNKDVNLVIPSGIAVQNARTSYIGDNLTRDGYHLTDPLGRYIAALTYFKALTNFEVSFETIDFVPNGLLEEDVLVAFEAVNNAFLNPLEITESIYNEEPERELPKIPDNLGMPVNFSAQLGFWNNNATSISPETDGLHNKFVAVEPIPVGVLPVGSKVVLEDGYQFRFIRFKKINEVLTVTSRSENFNVAGVIEIDEELIGDAEYVSFNIAYKGNNVDLTNEVSEVAEKIKLYSPSGSLLLINENGELKVNYMLGFWNNNATSISPKTDALHNKFITTHPIPKEQIGVGAIIKLEEGYQFRFIRLDKTDIGFKVTSRTSNLYQQNEIVVDAEMLAGANYFSFNLQQIGGPVIEDIKLVASKLKIMPAKYEEVVLPDVNHVDETLFFTSGYWNDKQTSITPGTNAFSKTFAASNVLSKESIELKNKTEIVVEKGYQIRIIFVNYDNKGNYLVEKRSSNFTGTINLLEDLNYKEFDYIAFNISKLKVGDQTDEDIDISLMLEELITKIEFK